MAEQDPGGEGMPGAGAGRGWFRLPSWLRSELLHEWIRSGGILIAAGWGVYTFVWKDILVPSWQPATISLEASLTPVADRPPGPDGVEMTLELKGSNSSSRRVYPLANVWWLTELQRQAPAASGPPREGRFWANPTRCWRRWGCGTPSGGWRAPRAACWRSGACGMTNSSIRGPR